MRATLATIRLVLELGWLVPLVIAIGQYPGLFHNIAPLPVYIGLAFIQVVVLQRVASAKFTDRRLPWAYLAAACGFALLTATAVQIVSALVGVQVTIWTFGVNLILLGIVSLRGTRVSTESASYQDMMGDFRTGVFAMVVSVVLIYASPGLHFERVQAVIYPVMIGYTLVGVFGLALARRFARDDVSADTRGAKVEAEWVMATVVLLGFLGIAGFVLVQLFAVDFVGMLGNLTAPVRDAAARGFALAVGGMVNVVLWILQSVGLHHTGRHRPVVPTGGIDLGRGNGHRPRHQPPNVIVERILEALGIVLIGAVVITIVVIAIHTTHFRTTRRLQGEWRTSTWSWRKVLDWLFRRSREQLKNLMPHPDVRAMRRRRLSTVRDVYRELLLLGDEEGRPKALGETGHEYSRALAARWPTASEPLDRLTALYAVERYDGQTGPPETVQSAITDLRAIEDGMHS